MLISPLQPGAPSLVLTVGPATAEVFEPRRFALTALVRDGSRHAGARPRVPPEAGALPATGNERALPAGRRSSFAESPGGASIRPGPSPLFVAQTIAQELLPESPLASSTGRAGLDAYRAASRRGHAILGPFEAVELFA